MLDALKRWLRQQGTPPLLVRLRDGAGFVEGAVELTAVWQPSGRRQTTTSWSAQGLCIIPWGGGSTVDLHVAHPRGRATLRARAVDAELGEARVVWLEGHGSRLPEQVTRERGEVTPWPGCAGRTG